MNALIRGHPPFFEQITDVASIVCCDMTPFWWTICQEKLEPVHEKLLCVVNQLSQHEATDHAWLEMVDPQFIVSEMGVQSFAEVLSIARELEQWGIVSGIFTTDITASLQSTFKGLVWDTRRSFTLESKFIDDLVSVNKELPPLLGFE
jgi:hypothetical protein